MIWPDLTLQRIVKTLQSQIFIILCYAEAWNEWGGPSPRISAWATSAPKKRRSGGEPLATLCPLWHTRDLNSRPLAPHQ